MIAATRHAASAISWARAAFESRVNSAQRLWKKPASATRSTPKDQTEDETDPQCGKDRLGRILPHILFGIFVNGARATARFAPGLLGAATGVAPHLFGLVAVLARD